MSSALNLLAAELKPAAVEFCQRLIRVPALPGEEKGVADLYLAEMARSHNDANVLSMGGRVVSVELADRIVETFLTTPFEGGRHERRVAQLADIEQQEGN